MNTRVRLALAIGAVSLGVVGCSASVSVGSPPKVSKETVQEQISSQIQAQVGQAPSSVECPEDLEAKVGATLRCTLSDGPTKYGVGVTVTSVEDDQAKFDIKVDDTPMN